MSVTTDEINKHMKLKKSIRTVLTGSQNLRKFVKSGLIDRDSQIHIPDALKNQLKQTYRINPQKVSKNLYKTVKLRFFQLVISKQSPCSLVLSFSWQQP